MAKQIKGQVKQFVLSETVIEGDDSFKLAGAAFDKRGDLWGVYAGTTTSTTEKDGETVTTEKKAEVYAKATEPEKVRKDKPNISYFARRVSTARPKTPKVEETSVEPVVSVPDQEPVEEAVAA